MPRDRGGNPYPGLIFSNELDAVAQALQVRGGAAGPFQLRSDAGLHLSADVGPMLALRDTQVRRLELNGSSAPADGSSIVEHRFVRDSIIAMIDVFLVTGGSDAGDWTGGLARLTPSDTADVVTAGQVWRATFDQSEIVIDGRPWMPQTSDRIMTHLPVLVKQGQTIRLIAQRSASVGNRVLAWEVLIYEARTPGIVPRSR